MEQSENEYRRQRIENLNKLEAAGFPAFGPAFERTARLDRLHAEFEEGRCVNACGRVVAMRKMGKIVFAHISDGSAKFQLMVKKDLLGEQCFAAFKLLDLGDIIGCAGELFMTRTEAETIRIRNWMLLTKALLPPPEKFHGLADIETRYRCRSLDLISNQEAMNVFKMRTQIMREIRSFLDRRGYCEVETPMLQQIAGGADAKPFKARYNALNLDVFMRIAPELYLKHLIVGGMDRVYEMGRNFRNEGLDRIHNPEFTALEIYQAYGNMRTMQDLIQSMFACLTENIFGKNEFEWLGNKINLTTPWREIAYCDLISEHLGADWFEKGIDEAKNKAAELETLIHKDMNFREITHEIYEKKIEGTLVQPTFITRMPKELIPLANHCPDNPEWVDVFELIIGGKEIGTAYSELNNPFEQRRRFEEQAADNESKIDEEFLTALEYGMPPTGGMGIGIDRLIMLFTNSNAIRDVILFPQLKPHS